MLRTPQDSNESCSFNTNYYEPVSSLRALAHFWPQPALSILTLTDRNGESARCGTVNVCSIMSCFGRNKPQNASIGRSETTGMGTEKENKT